MDWIDRLSGILTTKAMAATSAATAAGGAATAQIPRLADSVLFHAWGYDWTLPAVSMSAAIIATVLAIFKPLIVGILRMVWR